MLKNYLKIAWRSLATNKTYSFINIGSLALGLSACMLIMLYARHEWSYDQFHKNSNRIYWVQAKLKMGGDSVYLPYVNYSTGSSIQEVTPAVENFVRIKQPDQEAIIQNTESTSLKFLENKFMFADSNFFNFFSFNLLRGNKQQVLKNPFSVVLSRTAAEKYFGAENPIGKTIRYNNAHNFLVTGVAEDAPSNSSISFDFIAPVASLLSMPDQKELVQKEENIFSTYFLLKQPADAGKLEASLQQLNKTRNEDDPRRHMAVPLKSIRNYAATDKSNAKYLDIFPLVAGLILLLAIFNYISLTTARASVRVKEIGVRKVLGANRRTLALQFFLESTLFTTISFLLGYLFCSLLQPFFFRFLQIPIDRTFLYNPAVLFTFSILYLITVLLAASYPSVLLSAYKPALVLYGKISGISGGLSVRKFVTVFQFTISVILITCGIFIQRQLDFIRHADTGVQRDNVVMVPFGANVGRNYTAFKTDLQSLPSVQQVSAALHPLYKRYDMMGIKPKHVDEMMLLPTLLVDQSFISLLKLKWKTAPADLNFQLNKKDVAVLNETAVEKLNLGANPINQRPDDQFEVAGVLKDFNYTSLQNKIEPLCIFVVKDNDSSARWSHQGGWLYARLMPNTNIPNLTGQLQRIYEKYEHEKPFELRFMDEVFNAQYKAEDKLSKILNAFTAFAVFIALLGLFGLATFIAVQRTKEIGVRKVLGASVQNIAFLLSKDFIKLEVLAIVIGLPIAWLAVHNWLQNFAYRVTVEWWVFMAAGAFIIVIALLTVSYQAIRAAIANPAKSLRTE